MRVDKTFIKSIFKPIPVDSHKGIQGHALLIGGSYGKIGSVCLSSKASLRTGAGLVTVFTPKCGYSIVQSVVPEAMVITDINDNHLTEIDYGFTPMAIGIGMGIGVEKETQNAFEKFLKTKPEKLLIDADGLNILSINKKFLDYLPSKTILTPHAKELQRLTGIEIGAENKLSRVQEFCKKYDVIVVVKGSPTFIVSAEEIYENTTGNQALATAGSGDVLSGIITGFLAQNYSPINATIMGVYLHGLTADIAVKTIGYHSFIASDCIEYLGKAFLSIAQE